MAGQRYAPLLIALFTIGGNTHLTPKACVGIQSQTAHEHFALRPGGIVQGGAVLPISVEG